MYAEDAPRPQSDPSVGPGDHGYQWWVTNETGHDAVNLVGAVIVPAVTG